MEYTHTCQCGSEYKSDDPDPYKCPPCIEKHKALAASIEAKLAGRPRKEAVSDLQALENNPKTIRKNGGQTMFFPASAL